MNPLVMSAAAVSRSRPALVSPPPPPVTKKRRLGELLMDAGLITELQLNAALSEQRKWGGRLGRTLVEMGFVDEGSMATALSRQLQIPIVDLDRATVPPDAVEFLRVDIAERYGVFPVAGDRKARTVIIASADPTNVEQMQELEFFTGLKVQLAVAPASAIDRAIRRYYYGELPGQASDTTSPRKLGLSEPEFDPEQLRGGAPGAERAAPPSPEVLEQLQALEKRMAHLERLISGEVRALRGMLELLLEKGVLTREEYVARVRARDKQ